MRIKGPGIGRAVTALAVTGTIVALAQPHAVLAASRITAPIDESDRISLGGNTHPLARATFDRGAAPSSLPAQRMMLVLKRSPAQEAALRRLLAEQKNPRSPNYRRWLSPKEFGDRFGPSLDDLAKVRSWLLSQGFTIDSIAKGRQVIEFSGTTGEVERAFQTPIHKFVVAGQQHWANARDPQIPRALSPVVAGVVSLHDFQKKPNHRVAGVFRRDVATGTVQAISKPAFTFTDSSSLPWWAVGPADFATIYNVRPAWDGGIDGTGQTIAIVQRSNINVSDVTAFRNLFGLPANPPTIVLNGPDPGITPDETEALIDVDWSGAVAKGATIKMVVSASTNFTDGVDLSALYAVDNNVAPVMSTSFGLCELFLGNAGNAFYAGLWQQAAAQGITSVVSAGDNGSAGCDDPQGNAAFYGLQVNGLASTPYNVAVGGTDFVGNLKAPELYWSATNDPTTQGSALSYIPEITWNDSCAGPVIGSDPLGDCNNPDNLPYLDVTAGSGGKSWCVVARGSFLPRSCLQGYAKPSWQTGINVPQDRRRDVPDVSFFASDGFLGSFYVVCQADATPDHTCDLTTGSGSPDQWDFLGVGGTSVGAPAFAGVMALVNQKTGLIQGNANYDLYKLANSQSTAGCNASKGSGSECIFNDITFGTNVVPCAAGSMNCLGAGQLGAGHLPAYAAMKAYDRTTGLGSVNVANLVDNWPTSTAAFAAPTYTVKETAGSVPITVNRVGSAVNPLYVTWIVTDGGTGSLGTDFPLATGSFTLAAGATTGSFLFPVKHDTAVGDHTAQLALYPASGTPSTTMVTITNVDVPGNIQFATSTGSFLTRAVGSITVNLIVSRTGGTASGVTVDFAATDGTAVSPADYSVVSASPLTFAAGQSTQRIAIQLTRQAHASNPSFTVTLSNPGSGAALGARTTETVTIREK